MLQHDGRDPIATHGIASQDIPQQPGTSYANDDFDDVFGSAPASPVLDAESGAGRGIWQATGGNLEPSDVPRLKEKHETEGYRDGITMGKGSSVQAGFDEGYGFGAVLGLRIGKILGLLEGLYGAVTGNPKAEEGAVSNQEEKRLSALLVHSKNDLRTESVFGKEWWGEDGIWKFDIPGELLEGREVVFTDVAASHPLVAKWEQIVDQEIQKWNLDLNIMEAAYEDSNKTEDTTQNLLASSSPQPGSQKQEFSW